MTTQTIGEVVQVVSEDGEFNDKFEEFVQANRIPQAGTDYQVVAITGPQSSGKSTLMNAVFGTSFQEMDAMRGRTQTTKGIWLAQSDKLTSPKTLVIDLEGSDGRERGEDDSSFERQSSLFALAVADVLVVNMWAKDVGREAGAGKPLLKTIFQVNLKLFAPDPNKEKTVLLFVFRDRTRTPLARIIETWEADLKQMWDSLTKPPQYEQNSFNDFFEVKYSSLPNFEDKEEEFRAESTILRRRFTPDDDDSLVKSSADKLPGDALSMSLKKIWEVIKNQKDLNLPAHKVMVANVRCEEIMWDKLDTLFESEQWHLLSDRASSQLLPDFGSQAHFFLEACINGYDGEARYFEEGVRSSKRAELKNRISGELKTAFDKQLKILHSEILQSAKKGIAEGEGSDNAFMEIARRTREKALESYYKGLKGLTIEGVAWDTTPEEKEIAQEIDAHIDRIRDAKVAEVALEAESALSKLLSGPIISLIDQCPSDLWSRVHRILSSAIEKQTKAAKEQLEGFEIDKEGLQRLDIQLASYASARIATHFQEAANTIMSRMKDRFTEKFSRTEDGLPRRWAPREDISLAMQNAYKDVSHLLAQIAVLRLGRSKQSQEAYRLVDESIQNLANTPSSKQNSPASTSAMNEDFQIQEASEWPKIVPDLVFLQPPACRQLWRQFTSDSGFIVQQAQATQEANRAASNRMPPLWAIAAIAILGMNEFLTVLYNPFYLILVGMLVLFVSTVYKELDVDGELANGLLPGILRLTQKFVPTVKSVTQRSLHSAMQFAADPGQIVNQVGQRGIQETELEELHESDGSNSTAAGYQTPNTLFQTPQNLRQRTGHPNNGQTPLSVKLFRLSTFICGQHKA